MIERYTLPEMGVIWSEERKFRTWLEVETTVAEVQAEMGIIPKAAAEAIREKGDFEIDRVNEIELTTNHDVIAFLTNVGEYVGEGGQYLHFGMTSSDLLDTALALQMKEAGEMISDDLKELEKVIASKALEHKYSIMVGRTHGIHAEPITFGLKLAVWLEEIRRHKKRWELAVEDVSVGKMSGAVGTFAHLPPEVETSVCERLGIKAATVSNQIVQRDRHAFYLAALALIGASLEKFSTEIRHLQRTEVGEAQEYFGKGQKGSSAMPHKKNPILSERISGMARLLRGNALAGIENVALWHERDISHSSVERVIIPDSTIIANYTIRKFTSLLSNLIVNTDKMEENLMSSYNLVFSQKVLLTLIEAGKTREEAYQIVQRNALKAWEDKVDFKGCLQDDNEVTAALSDEVLEKCFDPETGAGAVDAIFNRLRIEN